MFALLWCIILQTCMWFTSLGNNFCSSLSRPDWLFTFSDVNTIFLSLSLVLYLFISVCLSPFLSLIQLRVSSRQMVFMLFLLCMWVNITTRTFSLKYIDRRPLRKNSLEILQPSCDNKATTNPPACYRMYLCRKPHNKIDQGTIQLLTMEKNK